MRRLLRLTPGLLALAALTAPGCQQNTWRNDNLSGNLQFVGDPRIENVVAEEGARIEYTEADLPVFQVDLRNLMDDQEARVQWRAVWYDGRGIQINDPARVWHPVILPARGSIPIRSIAPHEDAVRCEIQVQLLNPIE